ncbi:MAG: BTAD domain-containing putative transcriptional regulator, partial [Fimbriimonadaceae bacterium]
MVSQCRIELLGGLRVIQGDSITERFQTQKTATLLAYLALHRGKKFPREQVAELLWPDAELTTIRNRLNQAVSSLRRQLHPPGTNQDHLIVADYSSIALRTEAFTTDLQAYDQLLTAASLAVEETERIRLLEEAMPLYKGEFLAGYADDWVLGEQAMLAERQYNALSQLIKWYAQSGKLKQATAYAAQRLESDPLDERSHRALMRLHLMAGHPRMAVAQYDVLDRLFAAEGLEPSVKAEKLLGQARAAAENTTEHSIENLTSEDATEFDSSRAIDEPKTSQKSAVPDPSATIPRYFTPYFGREAEIQQVSQLLQSGTRLVTITGVGGVGKTRLAVEVARRVLDQFEGRIVFISLAGLRVEQQVADHCRAVIGGAFGLNEPSRQELMEYLMSVGQTLVITDNAEEVDPAGIQRATRFIGAIPKLQVLMTSRRTVGMEGEVTVVVGMLPVPDVEAATTLADLMENPSVALLVNR